jgi:hypothetical protein
MSSPGHKAIGKNRPISIGPLLQASGRFDYMGLVTARTEARPPGTVAAVRALHRQAEALGGRGSAEPD